MSDRMQSIAKRNERIAQEEAIRGLLHCKDPARLEQAVAEGILEPYVDQATMALQIYVSDICMGSPLKPVKGWLKALLRAGGDPDFPGHMLYTMTGRIFNEMWVSSVRFAASRGQAQLLKALLAVAREDHRTLLHQYDMTPIEQAAFSGHTDCVALLLDMGVPAVLEISTQEWTHIPELRNIYDRWRYWVFGEEGDDLETGDDRKTKFDGWRYPYGGPGKRRIEDFLLAGANNNYIHGPTKIGHVDALRLLIERSVVDAKDPLFIDKVAYCAVVYCNYDMLKLACEIGADFTKPYTGRKIPRGHYPWGQEAFAEGSIGSYIGIGMESAASRDFNHREKFAEALIHLSTSQS